MTAQTAPSRVLRPRDANHKAASLIALAISPVSTDKENAHALGTVAKDVTSTLSTMGASMREPATHPTLSEVPVAKTKQNATPKKAKGQASKQKVTAKGSKSRSTTLQDPEQQGSKVEKTTLSEAKPGNSRKRAAATPEPSEPKRKLTIEDLEFDYDRSKLSDPHDTPGRVKRPRWEDIDLRMQNHPLVELLPPSPGSQGKRKRLSWQEKDRLYKQEAKKNPAHCFRDTYICVDKGPNGSPTYDSSGFQLDFNKVTDRMKPRAYSKKSVMSSMDRALARDAEEEDGLKKGFFVDGNPPIHWSEKYLMDLKGYVKDRISKDTGVPWHQIKSAHITKWQDAGYSKVTGDDWAEPTEEDRKRIQKMLRGASLRKDL